MQLSYLKKIVGVSLYLSLTDLRGPKSYSYPGGVVTSRSIG